MVLDLTVAKVQAVESSVGFLKGVSDALGIVRYSACSLVVGIRGVPRRRRVYPHFARYRSYCARNPAPQRTTRTLRFSV